MKAPPEDVLKVLTRLSVFKDAAPVQSARQHIKFTYDVILSIGPGSATFLTAGKLVQRLEPNGLS
jgi:carbon monoxide dehydrogenase subunit G